MQLPKDMLFTIFSKRLTNTLGITYHKIHFSRWIFQDCRNSAYMKTYFLQIDSVVDLLRGRWNNQLLYLPTKNCVAFIVVYLIEKKRLIKLFFVQLALSSSHFCDTNQPRLLTQFDKKNASKYN